MSVVPAGNLIIIKTVTGGAMAAASAVDMLDFPEILGCIAGDDTIFIAVQDSVAAGVMAKKLCETARI